MKIRPQSIIKLISLWLMISALLLYFMAMFFLILPSSFLDKIPNINNRNISLIFYVLNLGYAAKGIFLILSAVVDALIAYGLWKFRKWSFYLLMIFCSWSIISRIIMTFLSSEFSLLIGVVIEAAVVYYIYLHRKMFLK